MTPTVRSPGLLIGATPDRQSESAPPLSAAAFIAELERLVLENAQLKAAMVVMDQEREVHAMPGEGVFVAYEPLRVEHFITPQEMWNLTYQRDAYLAFQKKAAEALVNRMVEKDAAAWMKFEPLQKGGGLLMQVTMFVGTKRTL